MEKEKIASGIDPVEERRASREALAVARKKGITFLEAFDRFFDEKLRNELKNAKHAKQWQSTMREYAGPTIGSIPVDVITVHDVLRVLQPIWMTKNETADRVRGRIERVLDWAAAAGHRQGENPARWRGNLQQLLPAPSKVQRVVGWPAVALDEMAVWFSALTKREGLAAQALKFLVLTAARSGEIRGAAWNEIDLKNRIWTVPASRMKEGREHRAALSPAAIAVLEDLPRLDGSPLVFPAPRGGMMSDMTVSAVMRRMQADEEKHGRPGYLDPRSGRPAVPHGLRSTFRDWAAERTSYPSEMAEIALAHIQGSDVERAYRRGDMLERRREMMIAWAEFVSKCAVDVSLTQHPPRR